jgi:heterodisulfide reductase subunit A-like polyferredoxin
MTDDSKASARRGVLRAGVAAVAAGIAGTVAARAGWADATAPRVVAQDKLAKDAVQYQTSPKDGAMCSTCVNFIAPASCQIVAGVIDPNGWCIAYGPKSS